MFIAIRKEPNGLLYIDKNICSRTQEVMSEQGVVYIEPLFTDEQLSKPPYYYTKVEIDDKYSDCIGADFNEDLKFNVDKYNARKQREYAIPRIAELKALLKDYDYIGTKIATGRGTREEYAKEIAQMTEWANEINELEQCKAEAKSEVLTHYE